MVRVNNCIHSQRPSLSPCLETGPTHYGRSGVWPVQARRGEGIELDSHGRTRVISVRVPPK